MIRINLLGQTRPKAGRKPVPLGTALPAVLLVAGLVFGIAILSFYYFTLQRDLSDAQGRIKQLRAQKTDLEQIKAQVESFQRQKDDLQKKIGVIEQLQRDRTGGQELLDMVANTVSRTENLWLNSLNKKGSALVIGGTSSSVNSVANFITQLKRSGYFAKVEIKETKQNPQSKTVDTFGFELNAEIAPSRATASKPAAAPGRPANPVSAPERKG
jgi:type IV pilus assembly protein PilN